MQKKITKINRSKAALFIPATFIPAKGLFYISRPSFFPKILSVPTPHGLVYSKIKDVVDPILSGKNYYPDILKYIEKLVQTKGFHLSTTSVHELQYGLEKLVEMHGVSERKEDRYALMITRTALEKLPKIRNDRFLPSSTGDILTTERVFDSYVSMANCVYSEEFVGLINRFEQVSNTIGTTLAEKGDPRARHWNVRKQELWDWCRVLIEDTAHPLYFHLLADMSEKNQGVISKFRRLFESLVKTVVWVSFPDDLADNYKHVELTEIFNKIPFSESTSREALLKRVSEIDNGLFVDYFRTATDVWDSAEKDFKELLGGQWTLHRGQLLKDYKSITEAMQKSAEMNSNPRAACRTIAGYEAHLQHNMMATSFNTIQTILIRELSSNGEIQVDTCRFDPFENVDFDRLRGKAQENARRSNNLATFGRELDEFDTSNILFNKIHQWYKRKRADPSIYEKPLSDLLTTYQDELPTAGIILPSDNPQKMDFFSLMILRNDVENTLYREYKKIDTENHLVTHAHDYKKAIEYIQKDCDILPNTIPRLRTLSAGLLNLIKTIANDSAAFEDYYVEWEDTRQFLMDETKTYFDNSESVLRYVEGWNKVHVTYLAMKYEPIF